MAARKQLFYIYRIFDRAETVYVGKGSGGRLSRQMAAFGLPGEVIERLDCEVKAYERERFWISELRPTENKNAGGGGSYSLVKAVPAYLKKAMAEYKRFLAELDLVGSRRYAARFLLSKLDESNCESYGVSKVELFRLREVSNGPWC